jgi:hypothetical protein
MKTKILICSVITGLFTLVATETFAQNNQSREDRKVERQAMRDQAKADEQRLDAADDLKETTKSDAKAAKADSKEANRLENDASEAAKEAKQSARTEARAQKTRQNADKQAQKAAKASKKYTDQ